MDGKFKHLIRKVSLIWCHLKNNPGKILAYVYAIENFKANPLIWQIK